MNLYIVRYSHRHGHDVWPVFATKAPTEDEIIAGLDEFEPERDEFIEIYGPFDNAPVKALTAVVESYDDTGCEGCGVVDEGVYKGAKEALGL